VSDQDFFFDEEEAAPTSKPRQSRSASRAKSAPAAPERESSRGGSFFAQDVSMSIAALMSVIGLLLGVIVGIVIPDQGGSATTNATQTLAPQTPVAPQLTEEQLNSGLPEGHPDISGMAGGETTASADATASE